MLKFGILIGSLAFLLPACNTSELVDEATDVVTEVTDTTVVDTVAVEATADTTTTDITDTTVAE